MSNFYRPPMTGSAAPKEDYTLWEACPNVYSPAANCYCLRVEARRGESFRCFNTYFYTDGSGVSLTERVAEVVQDLNQ